jgi:hypothetical protein
MPRIKEPHFYSPDFPVSEPLTPDKYRELFADANSSHNAIGEASVWYLLSQHAVPRIRKEIPDAKFIVMLRNPVEMAPSLHWQTLFNGDEDIRDFRQAWDLQKERASGKKVPARCRAPLLVQYKTACSLGQQLQQLLSTNPQALVHLVFLDDLQSERSGTWASILKFLDVPESADIDFTPQNKAHHWKNTWVPNLNRRYYEWRKALRLPPLGIGVFRKLKKISTREEPRPDIPQETVELLKTEFYDDIRLLEQLTGRDLSQWTR